MGVDVVAAAAAGNGIAAVAVVDMVDDSCDVAVLVVAAAADRIAAVAADYTDSALARLWPDFVRAVSPDWPRAAMVLN